MQDPIAITLLQDVHEVTGHTALSQALEQPRAQLLSV